MDENNNPLAPEDQGGAAGASEDNAANAVADTLAQQQDNGASSTDDQAEEDEWGAAADTVFPGLKSANKQDKGNEQEQSQEAGKKTETPAADQKGTSTTDGADASKDKTDAGDEGGEGSENDDSEEESVDTSARDARVAQREYQQQLEVMKTDVASALFPERRTELRDADGDPIRTLEDVMKLVNPLTIGKEDTPNGRAFTQEEAGMWLLHNQQELRKQVEADNQEINRVSELQIDIEDQTASITERYGELLKADPQLKADLWRDFLSLCETKTGKLNGQDVTVITRMPKIGLEKFYERALEPLAVAGRQQEALENKTSQQQADIQKNRQQQRNDRSDIYGGGNIDTRDDDTKEWDKAASAVFTPEQLSAIKRR